LKDGPVWSARTAIHGCLLDPGDNSRWHLMKA